MQEKQTDTDQHDRVQLLVAIEKKKSQYQIEYRVISAFVTVFSIVLGSMLLAIFGCIAWPTNGYVTGWGAAIIVFGLFGLIGLLVVFFFNAGVKRIEHLFLLKKEMYDGTRKLDRSIR